MALPLWQGGAAEALTAPPTVDAYYMSASTLSGLESQAYNDGYAFAQNAPGGSRALVLDFGEASNVSDGVWGACDFTDPCTLFSNPDILEALEHAAEGVHAGYTTGSTTIVYGVNNDNLTVRGMSDSDVYNAGYYQEIRADDLYNYQQDNGYGQQGAAAGSDTEPSYDAHVISNELVKGATAAEQSVYYDYGSADGCASDGCNNNWSLINVGFASYDGLAVPLPQIYYTSSATEWTLVRNAWFSANGSYQFWGITSEAGMLNPQTAWNTLQSDDPGEVYTEPGIVCFCG